MTVLSFEIPDEVIGTAIEAICFEYHYNENKLENETQADFTRRMIIENIRDMVKAAEYRRQTAQAKEDYDATVLGIRDIVDALPIDNIT